jgi:ribosome-binding factor A
MPGFRPERVAEMIHRELSERLRSEIKDPRVGPISITNVEVTRDLSRAVISYMPLGGGEPSEELTEGLHDAARRVRGPIGRVLRLRHAPELVFVYDRKTDEAFHVMGVLDRLTRERQARESEIEPVPGFATTPSEDERETRPSDDEGEE